MKLSSGGQNAIQHSCQKGHSPFLIDIDLQTD